MVTPVDRGLDEPIEVTGTFWPTTQPVSGSVKIIDPTSSFAAGVEARRQTPTGYAMNVQIGPGDVISSIPVVIEYDHHQIHEGEVWQWNFLGAINATTKNIRISVPVLAPTTRTPHLLPEVVAPENTSCTIKLWEDTTWTSGGTDDSANIFNRNRNVGGNPSTKIYVAGATALTVNATGTQIYVGYTVGGGKSAINADRSLSEWDLKSNTEYNFQLVTVGNGVVLVRLNFYEDLGV